MRSTVGPRHTSARRRAPLCGTGLAVLGLSALSLSGCVENIGPVEVSVVGGELAVAFCDAVDVDAISVEQLSLNDDRGSQWPILWSGAGSARIDSGEVVVAGSDMDGVKSTPGDVEFDPANGIAYRVYVRSQQYGDFSPTFKPPIDGFREGVWVTTNGSTHDGMPCQ